MNPRRSALLLAFLVAMSTVATTVGAVDLPTSLPVAGPVLPDVQPTTSGTSGESPELVAPYGVVPHMPEKKVRAEGGALLPDTAYTMLLNRLATTSELTPYHIAAYVADYYRHAGFDTPGAAVEYEENASISYVHVLGDIDGDGRDDVALNTYCNTQNPCRPFKPITTAQGLPDYLAGQSCFWPSQLEARSSVTGNSLWNRSMDGHHPTSGRVGLSSMLGCSLEFVVGTVPDPASGLNHLLVYNWQIFWPGHLILVNSFAPNNVLLFTHNFYLLNATDGSKVWTLGPFEGSWTEASTPIVGCPCTFSASNFLMNPLLMVRNPQGVQVVPEATAPGLLVQSVGFNLTFTDTIVPVLPYTLANYIILFNYQPDEWAMGVDLLTGTSLWRKATFVPAERVSRTPFTPAIQGPQGHPGPRMPMDNRSVYPIALQRQPLVQTRCVYDRTMSCIAPAQWATLSAPTRSASHYWNYDPCCFDITGDTVPDLVYTVYEWSNTPATNSEGPFTYAGRLVGLDGKAGSVIFDRYHEPGVSVPYTLVGNGGLYQMTLEHLGDADGDGTSEFFLHEVYIDWDYHHNLTLVNGKGENLWKQRHPRELQVQPLGDADGDGGVDYLFFDFTMDITGRGVAYSLSNVTHTPVSVVRGVDGVRLWQEKTFQAPSDFAAIVEQYRLNGIPDYDGDNVGDVWLDDPLYLPDLTTVHRFTTISGKDAKPLFKVVAAGSFGFPTNIGDVTGDGIDDFFLLNGDSIDLWGTSYHGNNGTAIWSRRVLATRTSSYATATPMLKSSLLRNANATTDDFLLNFHFQVTQVTSFVGFTFVYSSTRPQLTFYSGTEGTIHWALPGIWDANMTVVVQGPSPASVQFANALLFDPIQDKAVDTDAVAIPLQVAVGAATFGAAFGASFLLSGRRWKF